MHTSDCVRINEKNGVTLNPIKAYVKGILYPLSSST